MLEICIDSIASARAAAEGGADRVELCANLPEGGTTPSAGMIHAVRRAFPGRLMVIIRPRGYDFLYSDGETEAMHHDIRTARDLGVDGVVIGCLTREGRVDTARCRSLIESAGELDLTFHRAFDMSRNLEEALEDIHALGIRRVLTSGGQPDVPTGLDRIQSLVKRSANRVSLMPGGGVTEANLEDIVRSTGVREIHLSARDTVHSLMQHRNTECYMGTFSKDREYEWREASAEKIRQAKAALSRALSSATVKS